MFSRWVQTGIRAAERALADGRIDEAFARLTDDSTRNQCRARALFPELGRVLLARARLAAQAGRYRDALADLDRLRAVDYSDAEAVALRSRVEEELRLRADRHAADNGAFNTAEENLRQGRLDSGRLAIERLEDPRRREKLREELDIRVERSDQLISQGLAALDQGDPLSACRYWSEACERHGRTQRSDELAARLVEPLRSALETSVRDGRLDRLQAGLVAASGLLRLFPSLGEFERLLSLAQEATKRLNLADYSELRNVLLRLRSAGGDAAWVRSALACVEKMLALQSELLASPLGLVGASASPAKTPRADRQGTVVSVQTVAAGANGPVRLAGKPLLLLVDGTASGLLAIGDCVRIGRTGADVEVGLPADVLSRHAEILRQGDDYRLIAHGPASVNHQAVSRAVLRDGDRIVLGSGTKLVFRKPSVKSDSAVLLLGDRCRMAQDVSFVVLFKGTCLLGPQASCHVRTREGDSRLVLFDRSGELFARRAGRDGLPTGPAEPVSLGRTFEQGDLRLTLKSYEDKPRA
ncbi:MAG: FHA domain-containing protein [Planctomycetes bacterium]|nr:FHA domain-containing protein [Planctomycetota bacterium]